MPKVEEVQAAAAKRASPDVEAPARPVAQNQSSGEKEKTRVLTLLSHVNLPCSVASDAKQLEREPWPWDGCLPARRAIAVEAIGQGRKYGTRLMRK